GAAADEGAGGRVAVDGTTSRRVFLTSSTGAAVLGVFGGSTTWSWVLLLSGALSATGCDALALRRSWPGGEHETIKSVPRIATVSNTFHKCLIMPLRNGNPGSITR